MQKQRNSMSTKPEEESPPQYQETSSPFDDLLKKPSQLGQNVTSTPTVKTKKAIQPKPDYFDEFTYYDYQRDLQRMQYQQNEEEEYRQRARYYMQQEAEYQRLGYGPRVQCKICGRADCPNPNVR